VTLFEPLTVGAWQLPNRIIMAPMTRARAGPRGTAPPWAVDYYAQRASAGLIVSEGIQPSATGQGYLGTPGLHTREQVSTWRAVTEAVHGLDGRIVAQLMHAGRIGHASNRSGVPGIAPTSLRAPGVIRTASGSQRHDRPRALTQREVAHVASEFALAATSAVDAGFDGVEIHGANGYLLHQFLSPATNRRTDRYGGSPQARTRFALEVAAVVADAIGPERVGVRLSPANQAKGALECEPAATEETYLHLSGELGRLGMAYLSVIGDPSTKLLQGMRQAFGGPFMVNHGAQQPTSRAAVSRVMRLGLADMVAVGRAFIANPDLVHRWHTGAALNRPDPRTYYTGGTRGYVDYPVLRSGRR